MMPPRQRSMLDASAPETRSAFVIRAMITAPTSVPHTVPRPPKMLVPPRTVAAIASSSRLTPPMFGATMPRAAGEQHGGNRREQPGQHVDEHEMAGDRDARQPRGVRLAAAEGVGTDPEARQADEDRP